MTDYTHRLIAAIGDVEFRDQPLSVLANACFVPVAARTTAGKSTGATVADIEHDLRAAVAQFQRPPYPLAARMNQATPP
jgi:hypothetical protein